MGFVSIPRDLCVDVSLSFSLMDSSFLDFVRLFWYQTLTCKPLCNVQYKTRIILLVYFDPFFLHFQSIVLY